MMGNILQEISQKIKRLLADDRVFTTTLVLVIAIAAFGLGRQSVVPESEGSRVVASGLVGPSATRPRAGPIAGTTTPELPATTYVASKNGQVYHLPHCSGARRISEANKIAFETKAAAEAAGYRPAANCPGI